MSNVGRKLQKLQKSLKKRSSAGANMPLTPTSPIGNHDNVFVDTIPRRVSTGAMSPTRSKSGSLGSLSSETMDTVMVDQEDIFSLTHDVRNFSLSLSKLRSVFTDVGEYGEAMKVNAHNQLGEVVSTLKTILQKYQSLHSADIFTSSGTLIRAIKSFNYEDDDGDPSVIYDWIDQLALAFSSSVSEYLMGDVESSFGSRTRSFESLSSVPVNGTGSIHDSESKDSGSLTAEETDSILMRLEHGVDVALGRAKAWSKYVKDIISYVEKRALLEADFAKNLAKLASNVKQGLMTDSFLPFQSVYCTAMDQDTEYSNTCQATYNIIQTQKFIGPLNARRIEHDKTRKALRELWSKETKKMHDAESNLRKAKQLYISRQQEYENAREAVIKTEQDTSSNAGAKLEKRKKQEEDAMHKAAEAETTYKASVVEANCRQTELEKVKASILSQIRELIYSCDEIMKHVTVGYFHLLHTVSSPVPIQCQTLGESCQLYEPGAQFAEFVRRQPAPAHFEPPVPYVFEHFMPEKAYDDTRKPSQSSESNASDQLGLNESPRLGKPKDKSSTPYRAWSHHHMPVISANSDTESISGGSSRSHESSPPASPHDPLRHSMLARREEIGEETKEHLTAEGTSVVDGGSGPFKNISQSIAAQTHTFRKLRTPSKCRECDSYVYFNGAECNKCGMAVHKKCLEVCTMTCGKKPPQRRLTTFGIDFKEQVEERHTDIPSILVMCIAEVEKRGITQKGVYRVSGVKSRVEKLCQSFEIEGDKVDLTEHHPNVIANVLKLYLRQLPEPLLTFPLYSEFVRAAREDTPPTRENTINRYSYLVKLLPRPNFMSLGLLMHHLHKVSRLEDLNQMTASNLGIVFGPTLLKPREGAASLNSLMDTPHQTRAVELMIMNAETIFGPATDFQKKEVDTSHSPADGAHTPVTRTDKQVRRRRTSSPKDYPDGIACEERLSPQTFQGEIVLPGSMLPQRAKDGKGDHRLVYDDDDDDDEDDDDYLGADCVDECMSSHVTPRRHRLLAKTISIPASGDAVHAGEGREMSSLDGEVPTRKLAASKSLPIKTHNPPEAPKLGQTSTLLVKPSKNVPSTSSLSVKLPVSPATSRRPASVHLSCSSGGQVHAAPSGGMSSSNRSSASPDQRARDEKNAFSIHDKREPKFV